LERKLADFDEDDAADGDFDRAPSFWSESPVCSRESISAGCLWSRLSEISGPSLSSV
jgi:hypothetical protein